MERLVDPGGPNFAVIELRPIQDAPGRRLVIERQGFTMKVDLSEAAVLALMDECLSAIVEQDDLEEKCPMCDASPHAHDCELIKTLQDALRELQR